jgi:hypothetical protein
VVKTATTRAQYSGLNCSGESTTMKRIGLFASIDGMSLAKCKIEELLEEEERDASGGM